MYKVRSNKTDWNPLSLTLTETAGQRSKDDIHITIRDLCYLSRISQDENAEDFRRSCAIPSGYFKRDDSHV